MNGIEKYMQRAFELAQLGLGSVSPNPMVGCVIVKENNIIGEGYHQQFGGPHAEVNAINSVKDQSMIKGSLVIVSLEPCSHYGKTPPCADLLIEKEVGEVYISNADPNPLVAEKGIEKLKAAGIKVFSGISESEGAFINRRFFTQITKERPHVILKWAQTKDGFLARENFDSKWISDEYSRKIVHKWRLEEDAILVGTNTASYDNPSLNVRDWHINDESEISQPTRVVIDRQLKLSTDSNLFQGEQPTICYNLKKDEISGNTEYVNIPENEDFIDSIVTDLHSRNIQSLVIEGGAKTLQVFIEKNLWDEARIFTAQKTFGEGIIAPCLDGSLLSENKLKDDSLTVLINN